MKKEAGSRVKVKRIEKNDICREHDVGGRARVTSGEQRALQGG